MKNDSDFKKAVALAKQGKLEQAQRLLLTSEDPRAELLLERINKAMAAKGTGSKTKTKQAPKNAAFGCLALIALVFLCGIWFQVSVAPKPEQNVAKMCQGIRELGVPCDEQKILSENKAAVDYCQMTLGNWNEQWPYQWEACMEERGVKFIQND